MKNYEFTGNVLPAGEIKIKGEHLYRWANPFRPGRYLVECREETTIYHPDLYQIRATRNINFANVKTGDLGGWIEKEANLKHENCWVFPEAMVFGNAVVEDYAIVSENAIVCEEASVCNSAKIGGSAVVRGKTRVLDYAEVSEKAIITDSFIIGRSRVYGDAVINRSTVDRNAQVYGQSNIMESQINNEAKVCGTAQFLNTTADFNSFCQGGYIKNSFLFAEAKILNADLIDYSVIDDNAIINGSDVYLKHAKIGEDALIERISDHLGIMGVMPAHPLLGEAARPTEINFYKNQKGGISLLHDGFCCRLEDLKCLMDGEPDELVAFYKASAELAKMRINIQTNEAK